MADKEKKVDEAQEPVTEQVEVERVGEAEKAEAQAIEALPKVEAAAVPKAEKTAAKPSKTPKDYTPRLKSDYEDRIVPAMIEKFKVSWLASLATSVIAFAVSSFVSTDWSLAIGATLRGATVKTAASDTLLFSFSSLTSPSISWLPSSATMNK